MVTCKPSIIDVSPKLSETTPSLTEEAHSSENSSDLSIDTERSNTNTAIDDNVTHDAEEDSLMRRDIDSLHQSISNMREEFLER